MLGDVEVDKVTEMVVHVHPYEKNTIIKVRVESLLLHIGNCRNVFIQCVASNKLNVYCFLLRCNKNKGFSEVFRWQRFKLSCVSRCYLPASSFMKTLGFSMTMSQCPSSMG